jgi:hypothetical protein
LFYFYPVGEHRLIEEQLFIDDQKKARNIWLNVRNSDVVHGVELDDNGERSKDVCSKDVRDE